MTSLFQHTLKPLLRFKPCISFYFFNFSVMVEREFFINFSLNCLLFSHYHLKVYFYFICMRVFFCLCISLLSLAPSHPKYIIYAASVQISIPLQFLEYHFFPLIYCQLHISIQFKGQLQVEISHGHHPHKVAYNSILCPF